jgi:chromosome segregation ATPase
LSRNGCYGTMPLTRGKGASMGRQRNQIDVVDRQIKVVDHDLSILLGEFGMHLLQREAIEQETTAHSLYLHLLEAKQELDNLALRSSSLKEIAQNLQDLNAHIRKLRKEINGSEKAIKVIYARIGVIAWEEASNGVLDGTIKTLLPTIKERQHKITFLKQEQENYQERSSEANIFKKVALKVQSQLNNHRLKHYTKQDEDFYIEIGQKIAKENLIGLLASFSASTLQKEYDELLKEITQSKTEIELMEKEIEKAKNNLESEGIAGSIERKVQEVQQLEQEKSAVVKTLAAKYGKYFIENKSNFFEKELDEKSYECYEQIKRHNKIKADLEKQKKELLIESEIGELIFLIEQDEERIGHINKTIDQYNQQIDEIKLSIGANREKIGKLKQALVMSLEQKDLFDEP